MRDIPYGVFSVNSWRPGNGSNRAPEPAVGFRGGEGILTPGGSISNLMAVLAARNRAFPSVKEHRIAAAGRPVIAAEGEKIGQDSGCRPRRRALPVPTGTRAAALGYLRLGRFDNTHFRLGVGGPVTPGGPPDLGRVGAVGAWDEARLVIARPDRRHPLRLRPPEPGPDHRRRPTGTAGQRGAVSRSSRLLKKGGNGLAKTAGST